MLHSVFPSNAYGVIDANDRQAWKQEANVVTLLQSVNNGMFASKEHPENALENVVALVHPENISNPTETSAAQFVNK